MVDLENYAEVKVPVLGMKYHVTWAHNGVVGVCIEINGEYVKLITPKTKIPFKNLVHISELRHLLRRSYRLLNEHSTEEMENKGQPDCSKNLWKLINKKHG